MYTALAVILSKTFRATKLDKASNKQVAFNKTVIECEDKKTAKKHTVYANGDVSSNPSLLCHAVINEIGDTFIAQSDSKVLHESGKDKGKPIFLKGEVVKRLTESVDFKSFTGNNAQAQIMEGAYAYGITPQIVQNITNTGS